MPQPGFEPGTYGTKGQSASQLAIRPHGPRRAKATTNCPDTNFSGFYSKQEFPLQKSTSSSYCLTAEALPILSRSGVHLSPFRVLPTLNRRRPRRLPRNSHSVCSLQQRINRRHRNWGQGRSSLSTPKD
ncbi:hypothetical protein CEXT_388661 [Caerostris extrusa]|uniref:Uncharacterized protein n=1 Tax=Caerostris extrusa TaxID=172846 RepID=A0AAV4TCQ2_CAEEX|nr:hypothetical protein CEXT_388661 [Caerostris extrusa]